MKIAFFTDHFLPKTDGVVTRLRHTIYHLKQLGHEVRLFTIGSKCQTNPQMHIETVPGYRLPHYPERQWSRPHASYILSRLWTWQPDILHVVNATMLGLGAYIYHKKTGCPLINSIHTDYLNYLDHYRLKLLKPIMRCFIKFTCERSNLTLCTSNHMFKQLTHIKIKRTSLCQRGVDIHALHPQKFSFAIRKYLSQGEPHVPLMIYVGRLSKEKNLTSLRALLTEIPHCRLAFIGDGPERQQLEQDFRRTRTLFTGFLSSERLAEAYASADVLLLPSTSETLGLSCLEAMASGCPVVAANAGGIPELVQHGQSGYLFKPHVAEEMIEATKALLMQKNLRQAFSQTARKSAEVWDWQAATQQLVELYERVCL